MKVCIIVFSPSGHTWQVSEKMKNYMIEKGMEVQLLDVTRKKEINRENWLREYLEREVKQHDLLCIGGPVYAGHIESNVKKIINCLPCVNSKCGNYAIPFVTYGGLHSSIALSEVGELLYKSGRKNLLGMKISSFHTLTPTLKKQINIGRPNEEDDKVILNLVNRISSLIDSSETIVDVRKAFSYAPLIEKIAFNLLSQDFFHKNYKDVMVDNDICTGCGKCVSGCPVNMLELINEKAAVTDNSHKCILCAECYHNCPVNAVKYPYLSAVKKRLENNIHLELPQSEVYPVLSK
jgi:ferredoxin/flavodoxin